MKVERLLGLDVGDKYVGIALSDPLGLTAQPYKTYKRHSPEKDLEFFRNLIEEFNVKTVICGLPTNIDGTESKQTAKTQNFAGFLRNALKFELIYVDETLTTMEADEILSMGGYKTREEKKKKIDMIAAQLILQGYMDSLI